MHVLGIVGNRDMRVRRSARTSLDDMDVGPGRCNMTAFGSRTCLSKSIRQINDSVYTQITGQHYHCVLDMNNRQQQMWSQLAQSEHSFWRFSLYTELLIYMYFEALIPNIIEQIETSSPTKIHSVNDIFHARTLDFYIVAIIWRHHIIAYFIFITKRGRWWLAHPE